MTRQLDKKSGTFHFVGVGGIGMSGIAELMHHLGYSVTGSDHSVNANVNRLRDLGVVVHQGHALEHVQDVDYVVRSSAIQADNPEIIAARARAIPIVHRAEMLAEMMRLKSAIAVAGTHGKTTTTSLIAHVLVECGADPTVINGGIINQFGSNARVGDGEWMVVEADESDGSFVKLPQVAGVITNIDPEHLDHYGDFAAIQEAFMRFVENVPFFGFIALCSDHPEVQSLAAKINDRRIIRYGLNSHADVRAENVYMDGAVQCFDVAIRDQDKVPFRLSLPGDHNVCNALAAIAVARELGLPMAKIAEGLESFAGVRRRFQRTGSVSDVCIVDDYAHHPVEIQAVLSAGRRVCSGRLIVLFQPHRFSRLESLYEDFLSSLADTEVLLVLPVYAAGESVLPECNHETFAADMTDRGHRDCVAVRDDVQELSRAIAMRMQAGDYVLCLGAGSITAIANALPNALEAVL